MNSDAFYNTSQLTLRNSDVLHAKRCLLIAPPADGVASALVSEGVVSELVGLTQNFATYRHLQPLWQQLSVPQTLLYGATLPDHPSEPFDGVIFFLQKSKPLMEFWLSMVTTVLTPDAKLWLVGENGEGIKSWRKRLKRYFTEVTAIDSARHCGLIEATGLETPVTSFAGDDYSQVFDVNHQGQSFAVTSLPGVFSHGRLDKGTAVLLDTLKDVKAKRVLDFGCGSGVISAALALQQPEIDYTLVDCDALALASARKTLDALNVKNYLAVASDGLSEVSGRFDLIISNPPFHQGVKTHYDVTEQFLKQSCDYLLKGGELRIVANSFLRYEPIIRKAFGNCRRLINQNGFAIYSARKS